MIPYRGVFGAPRPRALDALALPPQRMPPRQGLRPLKAWRYVGAFSPELMVCAASVRVGPARQAFWAIWDRAERRLHERTVLGHGPVALATGAVHVRARAVTIDLVLAETSGIETVCASGQSYAWTRKQGGIAARGTVTVGGRTIPFDGRAVIDDTAAYYQRHTRWRWSAGVGTTVDGRALAWNLVDGVNDPRTGSERTLWIDGAPRELRPQAFAADLSRVGDLRFSQEAVRARDENRLLIRSAYRQPFGTFSGSVDAVELAEGYGVMEDHDVYW